MGVLITATLLLLIFMSFPIGMALGVAATIGLLYASNTAELLVVAPQQAIAGVNSFALLAIPLFILAGNIMAQGGIAQRIINLTLVFVGGIRGGLGMVTIGSTMLFSGVSGSASANTAAIGSVVLPEMKRKKYPVPFSTTLLLAAGGTSTLVPPSIDLIVIGIVANISISGLFIAGILPALVNSIALMVLCYFYAKKQGIPSDPPMTWTERFAAFENGFLALLMPLIILGGILSGVFTPTEASAVAVAYGFIVSMFVYGELSWEQVPEVLLNTCKLSGLVLFVLAMSQIFSFTITIEQIPSAVAQLIVDNAPNKYVFIVFVTLLFLVLGMMMDALPAIIILMPILVPVARSFGINDIHFGILVEANIALSLITPPVGMCLFVACGISKIPIEAVFKPMLPFLAVLISTLLVICYVPDVTLWLPRMFGYAD